MVALEQWLKFFLKTASDLDLEPRTLKVELASDIIIPNIDVKLNQNSSINVGTKIVTKGEHTYVQDKPYIPSLLCCARG